MPHAWHKFLKWQPSIGLPAKLCPSPCHRADPNTSVNCKGKAHLHARSTTPVKNVCCQFDTRSFDMYKELWKGNACLIIAHSNTVTTSNFAKCTAKAIQSLRETFHNSAFEMAVLFQHHRALNWSWSEAYRLRVYGDTRAQERLTHNHINHQYHFVQGLSVELSCDRKKISSRSSMPQPGRRDFAWWSHETTRITSCSTDMWPNYCHWVLYWKSVSGLSVRSGHGSCSLWDFGQEFDEVTSPAQSVAVLKDSSIQQLVDISFP